MAIMKTYGPRDAPMGVKDHPADHFARALEVWMRAMREEPADYLGRVYEEQAVANSFAGQFFTPEPLVELMAAMTMPDALPGTALVADPACGSGRMLIAGIRRNRFATFVGADTDLTCVHMATLNCLVRNANTWILHANSLSLEAWGGYHVRQTVFGGEVFRLSFEDATRLIRLPFEHLAATTALSPVAAVVAQPAPETRTVLDDVASRFTTDTKGQRGFGF